MPADKDTIEAIREVLILSPDNIVLRRHLAELLKKSADFPGAEKEIKFLLSEKSDDINLKIELAEIYSLQGKPSAALVIIEELMERQEENLPASLFLIAARIHHRKGEVEKALNYYGKAKQLDVNLHDDELDASDFTHGSSDIENMLGMAASDLEEMDKPQSKTSPDIEKPKLSFSDVGGMDSLKEEIRLKIIYPLTKPEIYSAYGKSVGGGILLYGPPGCGKTYISRATAGEVKARFISVGIHDILDMYIGNSEKKLHEVFELARRCKPAVLFFDEVDALGASRSDMRIHPIRQVINQFLFEMDGIQSSNDNILILAATNAPWHLDHAFRRPGRFDRIIFVPPPDHKARMQIAQILMRDKPKENIDFEKLAKKTEGFSAADIKSIIDIAVEKKLQQAMKSGSTHPLKTGDILDSLKTTRSSLNDWMASARNYALYSNQSGLYDDILKYFKNS